jgi:hypothetical protein
MKGQQMKRAIELTVFALIAVLALAYIVQAREWTAIWDANTEEDLAGYAIVINGAEPVNVGNVTRYDFVAGDSVCIWLFAIDTSNNWSGASVTVCEMVTLRGDYNKDGMVTVSDYNMYYYVLGMESDNLRWNERSQYLDWRTGLLSMYAILAAEMDLNDDGRLTVSDLIEHRKLWGATN